MESAGHPSRNSRTLKSLAPRLSRALPLALPAAPLEVERLALHEEGRPEGHRRHDDSTHHQPAPRQLHGPVSRIRFQKSPHPEAMVYNPVPMNHPAPLSIGVIGAGEVAAWHAEGL